ncbi:MAG: phosphoethanolamine transferase [Candidatus Adiutrix sp.]
MKFHLKSHYLIVLCSLYFLTIMNFSLWRYLALNLSGVLFAASFVLAFFIGLYIIFTLIIWPYFGKIILIPLFLISAGANYFMFQYGLYIESDMIRNVFQTHPQEAFELLTPSLFLWLGLSGLLPAVLLAKATISYPPLLKDVWLRSKRLTVAFLIIALVGAFFYKDYAIWGRNNKDVTRLINPTNYIYGTFRYFKKQAMLDRQFVRLDPEVKHSPFDDPHHTVFIMVVGEAARAKNFSLNGYPRLTNPRLSQKDIVNFTDVTASGTSTAISVPAMFSVMTRDAFNPEKAVFKENLLDLLQNAGYQVWWRDNDGGCKNVCNRVPTENISPSNNPKYCDGTYCFDEVLLDGLEDYLKTVDGDTFIVLHTIGSHGPTYYRRYPPEFRVFTPTCDSGEIQSCPKEHIVNTYDNTILYTDHVVAEAIEILEKFPQFESGLLYVSDHGQSLGENNIYLHGLPFRLAPDEQKKIPMILWMSETMKLEDHIDYDCLKERARTEAFSHDNLFHSLLGLMEIESSVYNPAYNLFKPCQRLDFRTGEPPIF